MNWKSHSYSPVIALPTDYEVYDFSKGYDPNRTLLSPYGIGKYAEKRPTMYSDPLFSSEERNIHMGIDIGCPLGTEVSHFFDGEIFAFQDNDNPYDYGPTVITKHLIDNTDVYALYGHLSRKTLTSLKPGRKFKSGDSLGFVGSIEENGGWNPHLHFQLCLYQPTEADLPGAVAEKDLIQALKDFPDPRLVLGDLY